MKTKPMETMISLLTFLLIFSFPGWAQKAPLKYGSVDLADLEMKVYDPDTSAAAVILCDYGYFSVKTYHFTRTLRVKILKKEGTKWANWSFPSDESTTVKGITYNLVDGEILETKLKSESVFEERIWEDYYRTRVAMPNVSVGSIIDIQYSFSWLPTEWRFQEVIPVKWSELIIEESTYIHWRKNFFGFVPLYENSSNRWIAKDVPAFKEEPYIANISNYLTKFTIEVLSISIPPSDTYKGYYREYSTTWEAVNNQLLEDSRFGMVIQGCAFLNDKVKEIQAGALSPMEKVLAAHDFVKQSVRWNENEALYVSAQNLSTPFNEKIGNSADVNLILVQMLKKLDFNVIPLALSTRSNGFLSPIYPSLDRLNYVVAYVWIDGVPYFADATEKFLPVGMLPVRCLNLKGRLITHNSEADWVDLIPVKKNKQTVQVDLAINPDLSMSGTILRNSYDYAALNFRNHYEEYNSQDEYITDEESDNPGLSITNFQLTCLDSIYKPVGESFDVKVKNRIAKAGQQLYLYPLLFEQMTENPFKTEERKCPVDFVYPSELTVLCKYAIPEGYKIVELPQSQILKNPEKNLSMQYQVTQIGNTINFTYKYSQTATHFSIDEYADIRAFFSELIKKHAEPVILESL